MSFEFLDHTADVKFHARGDSLVEVFTESARALFYTMYEGLDVKGEILKEFSVEGNDLIALLRSFLEEFIFLLDGEGFVPSSVAEMTIVESASGYTLHCHVLGEDAISHTFVNEVKSVTYNDMKVEKEDYHWIAEGVFDV
ncbi:MAG: SHS2 domain-containing protein [Patescibacteria group bacterium]|jgi:SHS2 domain-containing protein